MLFALLLSVSPILASLQSPQSSWIQTAGQPAILMTSLGPAQYVGNDPSTGQCFFSLLSASPANNPYLPAGLGTGQILYSHNQPVFPQVESLPSDTSVFHSQEAAQPDAIMMDNWDDEELHPCQVAAKACLANPAVRGLLVFGGLATFIGLVILLVLMMNHHHN